MALSRRVRGVILSTEMVLLLTAVIMMAVIAMFGMSKTVLTQATTSKQSIVVLRAEAWRLGLTSNTVAVTVYVANTGDREVTIHGVGLSTGSSDERDTSIHVILKPGETKSISTVLSLSSTPSSAFVYVCLDSDCSDVVGTAVQVKTVTG